MAKGVGGIRGASSESLRLSYDNLWEEFLGRVKIVRVV